MKLADGGIDIFYIDESGDSRTFVMTALAIPFLRNIEGTWTLVWEDQFENVRNWRRRMRVEHGIPVRKELHGHKLASGRGRYKEGKDQFRRSEAMGVYRAVLEDLGFLPKACVITVTASHGAKLYGHTNLEAVLLALFQRMRKACEATGRQGMIVFDGGHGEYRRLYRKARKFLPTGSKYGSWGGVGTAKNLPLDNFTKDANMKDSKHSFFIQTVDLIAYAAFLKIKGEEGRLTGWQSALSAETLYDAIPPSILNRAASSTDPQGIVRLK